VDTQNTNRVVSERYGWAFKSALQESQMTAEQFVLSSDSICRNSGTEIISYRRIRKDNK